MRLKAEIWKYVKQFREKNLPSIKLFEGLGFKLYRKLVMPGIAIRKEVAIKPREKIRSATSDDLTNVARLLNETWQNHELYEPASADILARFISRTPDYCHGFSQGHERWERISDGHRIS